ncbi:hypothetical protein Tco_1489191 [Tanacetum coccineum]
MSTPYPPTTSESSLGSSSERSLDSSSLSSKPSRKRCRSPTALVPSPTHVLRSIAHTPANLLPPRKRFRDPYSLEDNREEHMEVDTADAEAVESIDPLAIGDSSESFRGGIPDLEDTIYDIIHYMSERDWIDSLRWHMALSQKEFRQVRMDRDDTLRRLRRLESYVERHLGFRP